MSSPKIYQVANLQSSLSDRVLKAGDTMTGNLNVAATLITQNVIPDANVTYDLGSSTARFKDLWLSNSTIHLGEATISSNGGALVVPAMETTTGMNLEAEIVSVSNSANNRVLKTGDTMTGQLNISSGGLLVTGNVGIGTTSPTKKLHIRENSVRANVFLSCGSGSGSTLSLDGNFNPWSFSDAIELGNKTAAVVGEDGISTIHITTNLYFDGSNWKYASNDSVGRYRQYYGSHIFEGNVNGGATGNTASLTEFMRITDAGNVGIGTTSPDGALHVKSSTNKTIKLDATLADGTSSWTALSIARNGTDKFRIFQYGDDRGLLVYSDAGSTNSIFLANTGNVGIGNTAPGHPLVVRRPGGAGSLGISVDNIGADPDLARTILYYSIGDQTTDKTAHAFYTRNGTSADNIRMVINANGNVGIGTTAPGSLTKLNVNGPTTLKRLQKQIYNWYTTSGDAYVHFKTNLKLSGSGAHVGMWVWRFYGYSYGTANIVDSYFSLHGDTSGNIYSPSINNQGEIAFGNNMYKSSDNFLVIVGLMDNAYFFGVDVDVHHTMTYGMIEFTISAVAQSTSNSGVY